MDKIIGFLLKYKIVLLIVILILSLFFIIFGDVSKNNLNASIVDYDKINPYILVTDGNAIIKREKIIKVGKSQKENILIGDKIRTLTKSTATIFWSDGSVTRLGEKTSINITKLDIKKDISSSNIKFDISSGKSWSNIVRYLDTNSSFTETYDNERLAATVRGTVFEINLDRSYVHAVNHSITIKDTQDNKDYEVPEGKIRNSEGFQFLTNEFLENAWENWNKNEDFIYLNSLLTAWREKLNSTVNNPALKEQLNNLIDGKVNNLDGIKKTLSSSFNTSNPEELNNFFLNLYQNVNAIPNSEKVIELKANLRDEIINSATDENKQEYIKDFLRLNLYDYTDSLNNNFSEGQGKLKDYINSYASKVVDKEYLRSLLKGFDVEKLKQINDMLESVNGPVKDLIKQIQSNDITQNIQSQAESELENLKDKAQGAKDMIINIFKNKDE